MLSIEIAADQIAAALLKLRRKSFDRLRPPLKTTVREGFWSQLPFVPTLELEAIYAWRDGTQANPGDLLDDLHFFPGFFFLCMEEAMQTYRERAGSFQWRDNWFPVFADGAGDFYIVSCTTDPTPKSTVIGFIHGEPDQLVEYESLTSMLNTLSEAYAKQAIFVDSDNCLDFDDERYRIIALNLNPGISIWQS